MVKTARTTPSPSLRAVNLPQPVAVTADETGAPMTVRGKAVHVRAAWEVEEGWWRDDPAARCYYEVLLEGGKTVTLFHDLLDGAWYMQAYG